MLSECLESISPDYRYVIEYKDGSLIRGYVRLVRGQYYILYNRRSVVLTRVDLDRIRVIRYSLSRQIVFKSAGY